jgi:hypothetical protein
MPAPLSCVEPLWWFRLVVRSAGRRWAQGVSVMLGTIHGSPAFVAPASSALEQCTPDLPIPQHETKRAKVNNRKEPSH